MDRTLKVYAPTGHLFAEIPICYEHSQQVSARCTIYQPADSPEAPELKIVVPRLLIPELSISYKEFRSVEEIEAGDREWAKEQLAPHMFAGPDSYTYEYDNQTVTWRYIANGEGTSTGIIDISFSFPCNTKHLKFVSCTGIRYDCELSSNSLETNIGLIRRIPGSLHEFDTSNLHLLS